MIQYIKNNRTFTPTDNMAMDVTPELPNGTYTIGYDDHKGTFFFSEIDDLEVKGKIYGETENLSERILNTFGDRDVSTGVMLTGEKGSGKTLLAKLLSQKMKASGFPTIIINQSWIGDAFNKLIQDIHQPAIIIFDEFEKVYNEDEKQERILTLFDGVFPTKKLFVFTCNEEGRVNYHMKNRPGRIFYRIEYKGLSKEFIIEYCEDKLNDKSKIEDILKISDLFYRFNFDMLKALVEEINRYNEAPADAIKYLNAKPSTDGRDQYDVEVYVGAVKINAEHLSGLHMKGSPLFYETFNIEYYNEQFLTKEQIENDEETWVQSNFKYTHLVSQDTVNGIYVYKNEDNVTVKFTRKISEFDVMRAY